MTRVLAVLGGLGLLTCAVEVTDVPHPFLGLAAAVVFVAAALATFPRLARLDGRRRWAWTAAYLVLMLALGFVAFGLTGTGVGGTLLLLVLVMQAVLLLPLPGAVVVTAAVPLVHVGMGPGDFARNGLGALAAAVFTAVVTALVQREQRARADLAAANERLRAYAAQAEELATTQERNRLARDIHDGLGHHLTVVQMQVQAARAVLAEDPVRADDVLSKAQQQATDALAEVRRSVAALRENRTLPPLRSALEALAAEASATGMPTSLEVLGPERRLPAEAEESLFRVAQEGLTNVRKHAAAGTARLVLDFGGTGAVRLEVRDDGAGLPDGEPSGFGLLGLRERTARLGGRLDVRSRPGEGTSLLAEVPG